VFQRRGFSISDSDCDDDEAFFLVRDVKEAVERVDCLLLVSGNCCEEGSTASVVGEATASAFPSERQFLADGRTGAVVTFSEKSLLSMLANVIDAEAAGAESGVRVLAAGLNVENVAGMSAAARSSRRGQKFL